MASLFRQGGKAENPLPAWLCQVKTTPRPPRSPSVPTLLIPKPALGCGAVWGQPGAPSPAALGQLRAVSDAGALLGWEAPDGAAPSQAPPPAPLCTPPPTPPNLGAASYLSSCGAGPPGKRCPCLWGVCDVSLRLFPNHHIKLQRFSSPGLLYRPAG